MSEYNFRKPVLKQSRKEAYFCPTCDEELDVAPHKSVVECKCGYWSLVAGSGLTFQPFKPAQNKGEE
jgi:DNA-directed RNA polymerase subunit RPC12/RpoP